MTLYLILECIIDYCIKIKMLQHTILLCYINLRMKMNRRFCENHVAVHRLCAVERASAHKRAIRWIIQRVVIWRLIICFGEFLKGRRFSWNIEEEKIFLMRSIICFGVMFKELSDLGTSSCAVFEVCFELSDWLLIFVMTVEVCYDCCCLLWLFSVT